MQSIIHRQIVIMFISLFVFACQKNANNKLQAQAKIDVKVMNPNKSFMGSVNNQPIILNINTSMENDSIYAIAYNYKDIDPYTNLIHLEGIKTGGTYVLNSKDSTVIKGKIINNSFQGVYKTANNPIDINLEINKHYCNGNLSIMFNDKKEKLSIMGSDDRTPCQGQLINIGFFEKDNNMFNLYYLTAPSTGIYKSKGQCGNGEESLIAIIKTNYKTLETEVNTYEINSCFNAIESFTNESDFDTKELVTQWIENKKMKIKRINLKKDKTETIEINPQKDIIISIY